MIVVVRAEGAAPTTVFTGGAVLTMDAAHPSPDAVVITGDRIVAVGDRDVGAAFPDADVVDLGGRTLIPGLIDAHNHLCIAALHPRWRDVGHAATVDELLREVEAQAAAEPAAAWVRVAGWTEQHHGVTLTGHDLDRLDLGRPVLVAHFSLHKGVVNGRGLTELGIGRSTADPAGGEVQRGPDGLPNGVLIERAWSEAHRQSLAAYADPDRWAEHIAARASVLLADGITAVHDAACPPEAELVYRSLAATGALPLSVLVMPHPAALLTHDFGPRLDGPPTGEGDEQLRVGPAKLFADGGIAIALDVSSRGVPVRGGITMDDLGDAARAAVERGWRLAVHAIGNVGVERALDAFRDVARRVGDADTRFRVEHALVTSRDQCRALGSLGGVGVVQPGFVEHVGAHAAGMPLDDHSWLAFAAMRDAGVVLAGSSDDPCAPYPPLWCASKGATRRTDAGQLFEPDQRVPVLEWLRAYTMGSAFAGGQEHERGSITPGKRADLVVLEGDLSADGNARVRQTWVGGRLVFDGHEAAQGTGER
jgi:predicted amidohydrolase YtcJ